MLLADADAGLLAVVQLRATSERADEGGSFGDGRCVDYGETPQPGLAAHGNRDRHEVLAVVILREFDALPVVGVENHTGGLVVREERQGGRTTDRVGVVVACFTLGLVEGLNAVGLENTGEVLAQAVAVQNLLVFLETQTVQQLVVDDRAQLGLVGKYVAVGRFPVSQGPDGGLLTGEGESRLGLRSEGAVARVALSDAGGSVGEAGHREVLDYRRSGGAGGEQVANATGTHRGNDDRVTLDGAERAGGAGGQGRVNVLASPHTSNISLLEHEGAGHVGTIAATVEGLELGRLDEHVTEALAQGAGHHSEASGGSRSDAVGGGGVAPLVSGLHGLHGLDEALDFLDVGHVAVERGLLLRADNDGAVLNAEGVSDLLVVGHLCPERTLEFAQAAFVE